MDRVQKWSDDDDDDDEGREDGRKEVGAGIRGTAKEKGMMGEGANLEGVLRVLRRNGEN